MLVHFVNHLADSPFVLEVERLMAAHQMHRHGTAEGSDVAVILASAAAMRDGLGDGPALALASGVALLPVVVGDGVVPHRYPAARKHIPLVTDPPTTLRLLEDHRKNAASKIAEGKRELFGYGILLALLAR
jgi:hypothetical protein